MEIKSIPVFCINFWLIVVTSACNSAGEAIDLQNAPGVPTFSQFLLDCNTGILVSEGQLIQPNAGCDSWQMNRYERPFNSQMQDTYYADLDILAADLGSDGSWFYLRITPYDFSAAEQKAGIYALEMDIGMEGRGDYLVLVDLGALEATWGTLGVQVYADGNEDVGNQIPREPDPITNADGYELQLFDQGRGEDPDLAWTRLVEGNFPAIEIAFKTTLVASDAQFRWWTWADNGVKQPSGFDYHDAIPHSNAGDVYPGQEFFPANEVFALDSTCALLWNVQADDLAEDPTLCPPELISDRSSQDNPPSTPPQQGTPTLTTTRPATSTITPTQPQTATATPTRFASQTATETPTRRPTLPLWTKTPTERPTREPDDDPKTPPTDCVAPVGAACP